MSLSGAEAVRRSMMLSSGVTEKCVTRLRRICTIAGPWLLEVDHGREELRGLKRRGRGEDDDFGAHTKLTIVAAAQIRLSISLAGLSNDAQGHQAPAGILHRPDQQRPHPQGVSVVGTSTGSHLPVGAAGGKNAATRLDEIVPLP